MANQNSNNEYFKIVKKRDGRIVSFDQSRITNAILKAMLITGEGSQEGAKGVSDRVYKDLKEKYPADHVLEIEEIQDIVETTLIMMDYAKTAKAYILYRQKRVEVREKTKDIPEVVKNLADESKKYFKNSLGEFIY